MLQKLSQKLVTRIKLFFAKAFVKEVDDTTDIQLMKLSLLEGESQWKVERLNSYGFTSVPLENSEAVVIYFGGNRDHGVVIQVDSGEFRIKNLKSGETCFYSKYGQSILNDENGNTIHTAAEIHLNGNSDYLVKYNALKTQIDQLKADFNAFVGVYNGHTGHTTGVVPSTLAITTAIDISSAKVETVKV